MMTLELMSIKETYLNNPNLHNREKKKKASVTYEQGQQNIIKKYAYKVSNSNWKPLLAVYACSITL